MLVHLLQVLGHAPAGLLHSEIILYGPRDGTQGIVAQGPSLFLIYVIEVEVLV